MCPSTQCWRCSSKPPWPQTRCRSTPDRRAPPEPSLMARRYFLIWCPPRKCSVLSTIRAGRLPTQCRRLPLCILARNRAEGTVQAPARPGAPKVRSTLSARLRRDGLALRLGKRTVVQAEDAPVSVERIARLLQCHPTHRRLPGTPTRADSVSIRHCKSIRQRCKVRGSARLKRPANASTLASPKAAELG